MEAPCNDKESPLIVQLPPHEFVSQKRSRVEQVSKLHEAQTTLLNVANARPLQAIAMLEQNLPDDEVARDRWRSRARIAAVMGSCPRSLPCFKSGVKHWMRFIVAVYKDEEQAAAAMFPPRLTDVLAWSNLFRYASHPLLLACAHRPGMQSS